MKVNIITGPFGCLPPYAIGAVEKLWYSIGTDMRNKGHQVIFISKKPLKESSWMIIFFCMAMKELDLG